MLNLDSSDSSSVIPVGFCNTVLEKDREGHWTDRVKNGELLQRVKNERNMQ